VKSKATQVDHEAPLLQNLYIASSVYTECSSRNKMETKIKRRQYGVLVNYIVSTRPAAAEVNFLFRLALPVCAYEE